MRRCILRMLYKGKWYLEHWAAFQCREWALRTGELPEKIIIDKVVTRIPGPELVRKKGPYHPRKLRASRKNVKTIPCEPTGRLPLYMKERHGLPITEDDRQRAAKLAEKQARTWQNRKDSWRRRRDWGGGPDAPPKSAPPQGGERPAPAGEAQGARPARLRPPASAGGTEEGSSAGVRTRAPAQGAAARAAPAPVAAGSGAATERAPEPTAKMGSVSDRPVPVRRSPAGPTPAPRDPVSPAPVHRNPAGPVPSSGVPGGSDG